MRRPNSQVAIATAATAAVPVPALARKVRRIASLVQLGHFALDSLVSTLQNSISSLQGLDTKSQGPQP